MPQLSPITHISLQSFFACVEQAAHRQLARKPVAVTDAQRTRIVSVSPEAKRFGITKGMMLTEAMRQAPGITYLTGSIKLYQQYSERFFKLVYAYTDSVEPLTLDQAYLQLPNNSWESNRHTLTKLERETFDQLGIRVRIGVATTKITAYLASKYGQAAVTVIKPGRERLFLNTLPLHALPSIGQRTATALSRFGILTLRQLALAPDSLVQSQFGETGLRLKEYARGHDPRAIVRVFDQATLSRSSEKTAPTTNIFAISQLADQALYRLEEACRSSAQHLRQLTVTVVTDTGQHSHAIDLPRYSATATSLRASVMRSLPLLIRREPVCQIRLHAAQLKTDTASGSFFSTTLASLYTIRQSLQYLYHQFGWRSPAL